MRTTRSGGIPRTASCPIWIFRGRSTEQPRTRWAPRSVAAQQPPHYLTLPRRVPSPHDLLPGEVIVCTCFGTAYLAHAGALGGLFYPSCCLSGESGSSMRPGRSRARTIRGRDGELRKKKEVQIDRFFHTHKRDEITGGHMMRDLAKTNLSAPLATPGVWSPYMLYKYTGLQSEHNLYPASRLRAGRAL